MQKGILPETLTGLSTGTEYRDAGAGMPATTVLFASAPSYPGAKRRLAAHLLEERHRRDPLSDRPCPEKFSLGTTSLGAPYLFSTARTAPSISFSRSGAQQWAAICERGRIGIDVASAREFTGKYPFDRVFHPFEMAFAARFGNQDRACSAALIWSAKEAAVKAVGTGFHFTDPRDVVVEPERPGAAAPYLQVWIDRPILIRSRRVDDGWLSLATAAILSPTDGMPVRFDDSRPVSDL